MDFICSTATMEHIPEPEIVAIMKECARICSPAGKVSFLIDYHDHYGTADGRITMWNFYRYSARTWRRFNPPNHYQNRLRHSDYEKIFAGLGFGIQSAEGVIPDWGERQLERIPVCRDFAHYSREDLITVAGKYLLTPPAKREQESTGLMGDVAVAEQLHQG